MANLNLSLQQNPPAPTLLTTKLNMPLQKPNLVVRQALINRLNEGLQSGARLFLLSAPAGYGKTTLVCQWLNESYSYVWLSLDKMDNDPILFLTYLVTALRKIAPEIGKVTLSLFGLTKLPPINILITPLINELAELDERIMVILDDYHLVSNSYIHNLIQFLLDHHPPLLHLVLITREEPPLSLARMRAKDEIIQLRTNDLRFSDEEIVTFLSKTMRLDLEDEAVALLILVTEGWIAGLQLVVLSMYGRSTDEIANLVLGFKGNNRYITDYLVSEVLSNLPGEIRNFLQQTVVLDRLSASLCSVVTGMVESQATLELLERSNLFLFPLDDRRQWYRYHPLFADSLRTRLSREEEQSIHRKAAHWYENNGYLEEAVLQAIAADDYQEAARLIYLVAPEILLTGRFNTTIMKWLDTLPVDFVRTSSKLALIKMYGLYFAGQIEAIIPLLIVFENDLKNQTEALTRGRLYNILSVLANYREEPHDLQLAKEALELVKESDIDYACALIACGLAYRRAGNLIKATEVFRESFQIRKRQGYTFIAIYTLYHLLSTLELNGRLSEAIRLGEDILAEMVDRNGMPFPLARVVHLALGFLYYKTNNLEKALQYTISGIDTCRKLSIHGLVNGEYLLAQIYNALGDSQKALITIRGAIQELNPSVQTLTNFENTALEVELLLRKGELKTAVDWANFWQLTPDDKPTMAKEQPYLTFTRLLIIQERFEEALNLLDYLEESTQVGQRYSRLIIVHILQALIYNYKGEELKSLQYLSQALKLAAPEGYYRPFLDGGHQIMFMLLNAKVSDTTFIEELLKAFTKKFNVDFSSTSCLMDLLSNRELEVLKLIVAGFSNEEIALKLAISLNTTKTHNKNIFQKLGVKNRTQAAIKAKELNLV